MFDCTENFSPFADREESYLISEFRQFINRKGSFVDLLAYDSTIIYSFNGLLNLDTELDLMVCESRNTSASSIGKYEAEENEHLDSKSGYSKNSQSFIKSQLVGKLTSFERELKVRKYLEKKKKRVWAKRISYNCRKKVADMRIRVKGRFVREIKSCD